MGDLSVYRVAGLALDVKAALRRQRDHWLTDEAALSIVHTWLDTIGGPTAVAAAMRQAGLAAGLDQDVVWQVFRETHVVPPTCGGCGHSRAAHEAGPCRHVNPDRCACPVWHALRAAGGAPEARP